MNIIKSSINDALYERMWNDAYDYVLWKVSHQVFHQVRHQVSHQVDFVIMGVNGAIENQLFEKYKS